MDLAPKDEPNPRHIRIWPGVVFVVLQWSLWLLVPVFDPDAVLYSLAGGLVGGGLAVLVWWLFFSRAPWVDRLGGIALMAAAAGATRLILDKSIVGAGMGMLFWFYVVPTVCLALVAWAAASRRVPRRLWRVTLAGAILAGAGVWSLMRTDGITGEGYSQFAWRWAKTSEQKLLTQAAREPAPAASPLAMPAPPATAVKEESPAPPAITIKNDSSAAPRIVHAVPAALHPEASKPLTVAPRSLADWPGFRGPHRDDIVTGVRIRTDWSASPPVVMWRRPVGPGWSSFAVRDGLIYTQEQRGDSEVVACYQLATGEPVWTHRDTARFYESNGGPGPRGTPTLYGGRVYTFGATGILNALDAATGAVVWTRNAASDAGVKLPEWGFASSPLVVDDLVVVAASGRLSAYDRATGHPRWLGPAGAVGYSSPQLATLGGVAQVLLLSGSGLASVAPADGAVLWNYSWAGYPIIQPALPSDGGVLIAVTDSSGIRRLAIAQGPGGWTAQELWTSNGLKPYFNDFVVHDGNAYGFDGGILSAIDLKDGSRKWKGGRYGHGQLLLLADQDLLLVTSEEGELALVAATPAQFTEVARFPAIEGKTWNHPVLAGDILLVRNGQEMVAFRLSLAGA